MALFQVLPASIEMSTVLMSQSPAQAWPRRSSFLVPAGSRAPSAGKVTTERTGIDSRIAMSFSLPLLPGTIGVFGTR